MRVPVARVLAVVLALGLALTAGRLRPQLVAGAPGQCDPAYYAGCYLAGWNLVSGPQGSTLNGAEGNIYTWQPGDSTYEVFPASTPLDVCRGYWAYFPDGGSISVGSGGDRCFKTLPLNQWVLMGNPSDVAGATVNGADQVVLFDPFHGYGSAPGTPIIAVGQGAWIIAQGGIGVTITALSPGQSATGCAPADAQAAIRALNPLVQEFSDTAMVAVNAPRVGLAAMITQLQAAHRSLIALDMPRCAKGTQSAFDSAMYWEIQSLNDFLGQLPAVIVQQEHGDYLHFWAIGQAGLQALAKA